MRRFHQETHLTKRRRKELLRLGFGFDKNKEGRYLPYGMLRDEQALGCPKGRRCPCRGVGKAKDFLTRRDKVANVVYVEQVGDASA